MAFHDLVATAVLEKDREAAVHALMIGPAHGGGLFVGGNPAAMFDEMAAAQKDYLPAFLNPEPETVNA